MKRDSWLRQAKRESMKKNRNTFAQRVSEAVRLKKPVVSVEFTLQQKENLRWG